MVDTAASELRHLFSYYNAALLVQGFVATLVLSAVGCAAGFAVGFAVAVVRVTRTRALAPARALLFAYCLVFRRIPFLVTLMLVFFASQSSGAKLSTFAVALVSVSLIASAYLGEIVRSGLESVHPNQREAAVTLNFGYLKMLRYVVVPQAWRVIVPPTFGFFVHVHQGYRAGLADRRDGTDVRRKGAQRQGIFRWSRLRRDSVAVFRHVLPAVAFWKASGEEPCRNSKSLI
ncbi:ABC transporter permease subunit [Burkholderia sp. E168m30]|uniref:ABC transporter permease subunit n=1 Tax=Burkholderia sp. E168m30 TaxID=1561201 RepID=UPI001EEC10A4|nr:ABC transporter permease subunit [Burkholderia sp. E168m30]